jgi:hypothetical protein
MPTIWSRSPRSGCAQADGAGQNLAVLAGQELALSEGGEADASQAKRVQCVTCGQTGEAPVPEARWEVTSAVEHIKPRSARQASRGHGPAPGLLTLAAAPAATAEGGIQRHGSPGPATRPRSREAMGITPGRIFQIERGEVVTIDAIAR